MSKKPLCAFCGKKLSPRANLIVQYMAVPGKPQIGWHTPEVSTGTTEEERANSCSRDSVFGQAMSSEHDSDAATLHRLKTIHARGPGRVTGGQKMDPTKWEVSP